MDFDVIVIGSGFGGSVSALRLTEKGYDVAVIEAGARFADEDLPNTSFETKKYIFKPEVGLYGIQRIDVIKDVLILSGAGVGGGSLVYANTLYQPPDAFYDDPQWRDITDWKAELAPYYDQAGRMLGVITNPWHSPSDEVIRQVAVEMGKADTFRYTPVGVLFPRDGEEKGQPVEDPFFGGEGPAREGCHLCGECLTGCPHGAKNPLDKNYLYLADKAGATVLPNRKAVNIIPLAGGGYEIRTKDPLSGRKYQPLQCGKVVLAGGVLGTLELLFRCRDVTCLLYTSPSPRDRTRTRLPSSA